MFLVCIQVPFGYRIEPKTKKIIVEEDEAEVIRKLFDMYANQGNSTVMLARHYHETGEIPSRVTVLSKPLARCATAFQCTWGPAKPHLQVQNRAKLHLAQPMPHQEHHKIDSHCILPEVVVYLHDSLAIFF